VYEGPEAKQDPVGWEVERGVPAARDGDFFECIIFEGISLKLNVIIIIPIFKIR